MARTVLLFMMAALLEIGGGYLVWTWMKNGKPLYMGIAGFVILGSYGVIAALQTQNFARTYAAYGGFFIICSLLWAAVAEHYRPDIYDVIGATLAVTGACVMYFAPR